MDNKRLIDKENWQKAQGIKKGWTNSALAERDYSIECDSPYCITVIQRYWLWWCSIHHQPLLKCEIVKSKIIIQKLEMKNMETETLNIQLKKELNESNIERF